MPEDVHASDGLIGPNAILQYLPILDQTFGEAARQALLQKANVTHIPDGTSMIPEGDAVRLQQQIRLRAPKLAPELAAQAGTRTADYILAHRIPKLVQIVLKGLPPRISAQFLSRAIAGHAWTFVGSGVFRVRSPWVFEISNNPMVEGELSAVPLCHWHAAVFEGLYQALIDPCLQCVETQCCAQPGVDSCRFELRR
ncbi:MAG: bacteriochlorophyll 4-vinyl reductase [Pseudomonadota bacterium]